MSIWRLILAEIRFRRLNFALGALGAAAGVLLFVFAFTAGEATRAETTRLMRDLGLNLRIVPGDTDVERFWADGFSDATMPEEHVAKLARARGLNFAHLLPTLKRRIDWRGRRAILVGIAPEVSPADRKKSSMSLALDEGTVVVGSLVAEEGGVRVGSTAEIGGRAFRVAGVLPEAGSDQDVSIFASLADAQRLLGLEGRISEIQALDCLCSDRTKDSLELVREQLASVLPDAKVFQLRTISRARERERRMVDDAVALAVPVVAGACAAWIGLLAALNVRERWQEIGVLRALGHGSAKIAALFLGRAALAGAAGALAGFASGTWLAVAYGPKVFPATGGAVRPDLVLLLWSVIVAPAFAMVAALLPAVAAIAQDPAVALRDR